MARDFYAWVEGTGKKQVLEDLFASLPSVSEGSARRAGVRSHAYPPIYNRGNYTDQDAVTHAADAAFYISKGKK